MKTPLSFFFILIIISIIPLAYSVGATGEILDPDDVEILEPEQTELDPGETLDLSDSVDTVAETTETIGDVTVALTQEVKIISIDNKPIEITNTAVEDIAIEIPNETVISGSEIWDGEIVPPTIVTTSGTISSEFLTPTSAISVGSIDSVLVFDNPVTLILNGTTGQIAYKLSGTTEWILISTCSGTFAEPGNPTEPNECSISDGTDTKILTFHFTEFAGVNNTPTTPPDETDTSTGTNSGGHGNTGVGSPRIFGPSSGGSSGGGTYYVPGESTPRVFPAWFDNVKDWYRQGDISALEFLNAYQWIIENVMK